MSATALVQAIVDSDVKDRAAAVLEEQGMTVSEAVGMFLSRTAAEGALPFALETDAAAHDAWFKAKVIEALDDPRPGIPHEEVSAFLVARKLDAAAKANG